MGNMHTFNHTHGRPKAVWKKAEGGPSQVSGITVFNTKRGASEYGHYGAADYGNSSRVWDEKTESERAAQI
eukprot:2558900-Pleurochrysis_carterae.AAC.1